MQNRFASAQKLMEILRSFPEVRECSLYGSLARGTADCLSDIDIELDVSGCDNGAFLLRLPELLQRHISVVYHDFAPSLMPEKYVVSIALSETDPFLIADICCNAYPHYKTVARAQAAACNDPAAHLIKLWTANCKHHLRGADCRADILRMAAKAGIAEGENKTESELLLQTLERIERMAPDRYSALLQACRRVYTEYNQ